MGTLCRGTEEQTQMSGTLETPQEDRMATVSDKNGEYGEMTEKKRETQGQDFRFANLT